MFYRLEFEEDDIVKPEVALVDDPAIDLKGLMLSNNKNKDIKPKETINLKKLQKFDNDKQIIAGPALVSDKWIYRFDEEYGDYYVMFTPDQVQKFKNAFEKEGGIINFEHSDRKIKAKVLFSQMVESDQSNIAEFNYNYDLKKGDWFLAIQIEDSSEWKEIKEGKHNGFSIEGIFDHNIIAFKNKNKEEQMKKEELEQFKKDILGEIKSMFESKEEENLEENLEEEMESKDDEEVEAKDDENKEEDLEENEETEEDTEESEKDFEFTQEMYNNILTELAELQNQINETKESDDEELSYEEEDLTKLSKTEQKIKKLAQNLSKIK